MFWVFVEGAVFGRMFGGVWAAADVSVMESAMDEERRMRLRAVEERLCDPRSIGNVDGLLDTMVALVSDCDHPAIRRMKNLEAYTSRCE